MKPCLAHASPSPIKTCRLPAVALALTTSASVLSTPSYAFRQLWKAAGNPAPASGEQPLLPARAGSGGWPSCCCCCPGSGGPRGAPVALPWLPVAGSDRCLAACRFKPAPLPSLRPYVRECGVWAAALPASGLPGNSCPLAPSPPGPSSLACQGLPGRAALCTHPL